MHGALMFVTTTVLGYTPALRNPTEKEFLLRLLVSDCRHFGAVLHAYCVRDHHLHMVIRAPVNMTMSKFMQNFKHRSASLLLARVTPFTRRCLFRAAKDGPLLLDALAPRQAHSEREDDVGNDSVRALEPVSGWPLQADDYPWSSALLFEECKWTEEQGVLPWLNAD